MKKVAVGIIVVLLVVAVTLVRVPRAHAPVAKSPYQSTIKTTMKLTSPAFVNNGNVPSLYTCDGENINPPLTFIDVPANAKSLVLIVDDPDAMVAGRQAPMGTWDHWVVFNIPPTVQNISENTVPQGVQSITSFGKPGYGGPCPPSGVHHYHFKLYALDTMLSLGQSAKKGDVEGAMHDHILAQTELVGLYRRQ